MATKPTTAQLQEFLDAPQDEPVVMMNLLRFKERADGARAGETGEAAMMDYARPMKAYVEAHGGTFLYAGRVTSQLIGEGGEDFQFVSLMRYPSRAAFLELAGSREVADTIGAHRDAGLESQWLLVTTEAVG